MPGVRRGAHDPRERALQIAQCKLLLRERDRQVARIERCTGTAHRPNRGQQCDAALVCQSSGNRLVIHFRMCHFVEVCHAGIGEDFFGKRN